MVELLLCYQGQSLLFKQSMIALVRRVGRATCRSGCAVIVWGAGEIIIGRRDRGGRSASERKKGKKGVALEGRKSGVQKATTRTEFLSV